MTAISAEFGARCLLITCMLVGHDQLGIPHKQNGCQIQCNTCEKCMSWRKTTLQPF